MEVRTNSLKAWILAARPKTLAAAAVPVMIGIAFAIRQTWILKDTWVTLEPDGMIYTGMEIERVFVDGKFHWMPAVLCLLFAWVMQIDSNLVNDYFDFKKGNDDRETRLGPPRACTEGWVTERAMKRVIGITTALACLIGMPLIYYGGMEMVLVGIACVVFCFLYTTTLSYHGMGDVLVLMFFGIVPVCCTYYVCMPDRIQTPTHEVFAASVACGMVIDTLLMVNNYRDRDNDRKSGKSTLVVKMGVKNAQWLYQHLGFFGMFMMGLMNFLDLTDQKCYYPIYLIFLLYAYLHYKTYKKMFRINKGKELNKVLGMTARNILVFGITCVITILSMMLFCEPPTPLY